MEGLKIKERIKDIVFCGFVAAFCYILNTLAVFKMPFGGAVKLAPTLPLIFLSFKRGYRVGGKSAIIFCFMKLMLDFHIPPSQTMASYVAVILFDYVLAYYIVGISSLYSNFFKKERNNIVFAVVVSEFFRFIFFTFSGVILWNDYFEYKLSLLGWCAVYNLSYMIPNLVISLLVVFLVYKDEKYIQSVFSHTF